MLKKITSMLLALVMVVTLVSVTPVNTEAAVKVLYGKKISLNIGKKDEIIVKGSGVTYKSSNTKVATVNSKGVVKAVGAGTCKITITQSGSTATSTITVKPSKMADVKAELINLDSNKAKVSWKKQKKVTGYEVSYSTKKKGGFKKVTVKGAKKISATISNLEYGVTYYVKVRAYAKAGKKKVYGAYSKITEDTTVKTWNQVWADEFNSTTLDTSKWSFQLGAGGYGNDELQEYTNTHYKMDGSNLVITPQFKWDASKNECVQKSYKSAKLWTKTDDEEGLKYSVKYGRIEFRAKLPKGQGTWAAAWMLGVNNGWPLCGEIDILETTSQADKTKIPQSIHCNKFNGMSTSGGNKYKTSTILDATSEFHTYGIIWTETEITFTIDGKETWTYDPSKYSLATDGTDDINVWPYNQDFYLIMNCAVGGTLGGVVGPNYWTKIATEGNIETYEDYYYIDWVRVYK